MPAHWVTLSTLLLASTLIGCGTSPVQREPKVTLSSLTNPDDGSKKYYLGWGEYLNGFMGNETRYDVKHTHDIFANQVGDDYEAKVLTDRPFRGDEVKSVMGNINSKMMKDDMYVQYSSGHGYPRGLGIGITYQDIVKNALDMPAKEVVIFTMACHSGGLVDQFNAQKSQWASWAQEGRTLFVMSSSTVQQTSSTGPLKDSAEPNGGQGSAGSAYGHALWKALAGDSDGYIDGVKDGFISLGEIAAYTTWRTRSIGGHTPQVTGNYNPLLIMNKVPNRTIVDQQLNAGGSGRMRDNELRDAIYESDAAILAEVSRALSQESEP